MLPSHLLAKIYAKLVPIPLFEGLSEEMKRQCLTDCKFCLRLNRKNLATAAISFVKNNYAEGLTLLTPQFVFVSAFWPQNVTGAGPEVSRVGSRDTRSLRTTQRQNQAINQRTQIGIELLSMNGSVIT